MKGLGCKKLRLPLPTKRTKELFSIYFIRMHDFDFDIFCLILAQMSRSHYMSESLLTVLGHGNVMHRTICIFEDMFVIS